jgi:putative restriction endonuclease
VVSGGYPDDRDYGNELVYTGQGGRDRRTKRQIADQKLTHGNVGLVRSQFDGRPVRVIRGAGGDPLYSPDRGLRYDGLFDVVDHWHDTGQDGFLIWVFRLVKRLDAEADTDKPTVRKPYHGDRIVRDVAVANKVKAMHDYKCQICRLKLMTAAGPYAEGAHIKALGRPHNGPDVETNLLCLCPNHHFLFDAGAIFIDDEGTVHDAVTTQVIGPLWEARGHNIDRAYTKYHREYYAT